MMCNGPVSYPESFLRSSMKNLAISAACDVLFASLCVSVDCPDAPTDRQSPTSIGIIHLLKAQSFNLTPIGEIRRRASLGCDVLHILAVFLNESDERLMKVWAPSVLWTNRQ